MAERTVRTVYNENYAPSSIYHASSEVGDDINVNDIDDVNAELSEHIFNKRQKLTTNPEEELDNYLKSETVKFQLGVDTLSWWQVSWSNSKYYRSNSKYYSFSNLI